MHVTIIKKINAKSIYVVKKLCKKYYLLRKMRGNDVYFLHMLPQKEPFIWTQNWMTHCSHGHFDRSELSCGKKNNDFRIHNVSRYMYINHASLINHSGFMNQPRNKRDSKCENVKLHRAKYVLNQNIQSFIPVIYFTPCVLTVNFF